LTPARVNRCFFRAVLRSKRLNEATDFRACGATAINRFKKKSPACIRLAVFKNGTVHIGKLIDAYIESNVS
jgi:hypothetical protein